MKYGRTIFLRDYDIISQPLLKSTCVFGPKKGVTCRPVYDNKFCFLSCTIVGTWLVKSDGPIFLFKAVELIKNFSRSFITLPFFCVSHHEKIPSLYFLRILENLPWHFHSIISNYFVTWDDTWSRSFETRCICLRYNVTGPPKMVLLPQQSLPSRPLLSFQWLCSCTWLAEIDPDLDLGLNSDPFLCKVKLQCNSLLLLLHILEWFWPPMVYHRPMTVDFIIIRVV